MTDRPKGYVECDFCTARWPWHTWYQRWALVIWCAFHAMGCAADDAGTFN